MKKISLVSYDTDSFKTHIELAGYSNDDFVKTVVKSYDQPVGTFKQSLQKLDKYIAAYLNIEFKSKEKENKIHVQKVTFRYKAIDEEIKSVSIKFFIAKEEQLKQPFEIKNLSQEYFPTGLEQALHKVIDQAHEFVRGTRAFTQLSLLKGLNDEEVQEKRNFRQEFLDLSEDEKSSLEITDHALADWIRNRTIDTPFEAAYTFHPEADKKEAKLVFKDEHSFEEILKYLKKKQ